MGSKKKFQNIYRLLTYGNIAEEKNNTEKYVIYYILYNIHPYVLELRRKKLLITCTEKLTKSGNLCHLTKSTIDVHERNSIFKAKKEQSEREKTKKRNKISKSKTVKI